jgi:hypothetical protein
MVNFFYLDKDPQKCAQYYCNKHVIKIPIEIAQILSKIHYNSNSNIDFSKIYKNSKVVNNSIGPYKWIKESYDNYMWACKLGLNLIDEYKLRYNKDKHKTEIILKYLLNNPPKLPKKGITKFIGTNKYDMFQFISDDPVICSRYNYVEIKCTNDKWNKDTNPPDWFVKIKKSISIKKKILIDKIKYQIKEKLPSLVTKGNKVFRFHSFLRVSYDHLFQGKWNVKAKMMNKYNKNKALIYQLTFPQLYYLYKITKSLENKKILSKLNIQSLRYRNKLKFPDNNINYRCNPEYYIYTMNLSKDLSIDKELFSGVKTKENTMKLSKRSGDKELFYRVKTKENTPNVKKYKIEPYTTEIDKKIDKYNSSKLYHLFLNYIKNKDFIGADIIRKHIQINHFYKELKMIENNKLYNEWCNSFDWKKSDPYQPNKYIFI